MSRIEFSSSVRTATDFVATHLLYPDGSGSYKPPAWTRLGWFSRISAGPLASASEAVVNYLKPIGNVSEREVTFWFGSRSVAVVTVRGLKPHGGGSTSWTFAAVRYQLDMPSPDMDGWWEEHTLLGLTFSSQPGASAPES